MIISKTKWVTYVLLMATIAGFFYGFTTITNQNDRLIFYPAIYIPLVSVLFIPIVLISILYSKNVHSLTSSKSKLSPTLGLWVVTFLGLTLLAVASMSLLGLEHIPRNSLESIIVWSFNSFLILSSLLTPAIDSIQFQKSKKLPIGQIAKIFGYSVAYYAFICLWGLIVLTILGVVLLLVFW